MKPTPRDVLRALDAIQPGAAALVDSADRCAHPTALRRVCVAVCVALGWSLPRIARDYGRDHSTIIHHRNTYLRNRSLHGKEAEAELFRAVMLEAHEIASRRGVVYLSDRRRAA